MIQLIKGDCLELMKDIPDSSIDAIITDPPYGTTACKWDSVIPFDLMWEQLNRIIKPNGAIVLFGSEPFSSALRMSNIKNYKYDWVWDKKLSSGFLNAKRKPLLRTENIIIFNSKNYYPIMEIRGEKREKGNKGGSKKSDKVYGNHDGYSSFNNEYYPTTILEFSNANRRNRFHPTQKPIPLMEYLIKTYTNKGETVLDFTMGSGTTGVACANLNRNFIGIELDEGYFNIAKERINKAQLDKQQNLFTTAI